MKKYRKKPVVIEAMQWTGKNDIELESWLYLEKSVEIEIDDHLYKAGVGVPFIDKIKIKTLEGEMEASKGDYIIKGVNGEFYPCKPDIFEKTYEKVDKAQPKDRVDTLEDTIDLMTSADYKERFEAEYYQLKIRRDKLQKMWDNWDNLSFTPTCKKEVYTTQLTAMNIYLDVLKQRAEIEGIELNK